MKKKKFKKKKKKKDSKWGRERTWRHDPNLPRCHSYSEELFVFRLTMKLFIDKPLLETPQSSTFVIFRIKFLCN